jgi:hypothetical protein
MVSGVLPDSELKRVDHEISVRVTVKQKARSHDN